MPDSEILSLDTEMNRGFLQVLVLVVLENPLYGYQMVKELEKKDYVLEENTIYPLLRRLEKRRLVTAEWQISGSRPKKFYTVTEKGRDVRRRLLDIWRRQHSILESFLMEISDEQ